MTTLVRFDPYREATALQGEVGRFLNLFSGGYGNTAAAVWAPAMDVWETDDEIVYAFDLPGIPKETVSIEVDNGVLTVTAERERSQEVSADRLYRYERRYGSFSRTIGLPQGVSEDQISARYKNGVLEVHAKKAEVEKPRRIQIANGKPAIEGKATKAEDKATKA
jgi:HSP20 family protein